MEELCLCEQLCKLSGRERPLSSSLEINEKSKYLKRSPKSIVVAKKGSQITVQLDAIAL